jgi:PAS domain-containing protein
MFGDAWVLTDAIGDIQDVSPEAARLLNLSQRGARRRNLATFFVENRPKLMAELLRAAVVRGKGPRTGVMITARRP